MKRLLALLFVLVLVFALGGCVDSSGDDLPAEETPVPSSTPAPTPGEAESSIEAPDGDELPFETPPPETPPDNSPFKNYLMSTVPLTITNDVFTMDIPASVPFHRDIEQRVLDWLDWIQEASGLALYPPGTSFGKMQIKFSEHGAMGGDYGIEVNAMDYMLDAPGTEFIYLHECSHTLQFRMVYIDHQPFQEAFAILNSAKAARDNGLDFLYWHLMHSNYSYTDPDDEKTILDDFELWYRTDNGTWNTYLFGFRFGLYLETRYGENILSDLIRSYAERVGRKNTTQNEFVDFLVEQTDGEIFTDFVSWYRENRALFDMTPSPPVRDSEVVFMPIINDFFQDFSGGSSYELDQKITFDFFDSHVYAQFSGYSILGISGSFSFEKAATIESYDLLGSLLETKSVNSGYCDLAFPDAASLVISGYTGEFTFRPEFEGCYSG